MICQVKRLENGLISPHLMLGSHRDQVGRHKGTGKGEELWADRALGRQILAREDNFTANFQQPTVWEGARQGSKELPRQCPKPSPTKHAPGIRGEFVLSGQFDPSGKNRKKPRGAFNLRWLLKQL